MKRLLFSLFTLALFSANAQNVTGKNGTVSFPTIADYEYFVDNPDARVAIDNYVNSAGTINTLKNLPTYAPDDETPEFLKQVLNTDNIVSIGSYYVKIDFVNGRGLAINSSTKNAYQQLVNNNLGATGLMVFTMEDGNALEVMEGVENGSASIANYKDLIVKHTEEMPITTSFVSGPSYNFNEDELFWCGNPGPQDLKRWPTWGMPRADGSCNAPGNNTARLAGDLKLVYQKAIIYFSLQSKEKCRQYCQFGGNPQTAGTISVYMYLSGTVKYKRCGWSERTGNHTSDFSLTNEKSWRPFESSRRLEKFDFTVQFKQAENLNSPYNFELMNIKAGY
jgi:hypothetical protein